MSLYIRMIILTFISFFTVRIVLKVLGVEDYGLYNVVGGFVSMLGFVSGTLTMASQRYFAFYLGKKDWKQLNEYFSINFIIYVIFMIIILIVAETVGLWFIIHKLTIPAERMSACIIVYQLSVLTFVVTFIVSPYLALMVADENLTIYSLLSIVEGIAKVFVVYMLSKLQFDKLVVYAFLIFIVSLVINGIYIFYCRYKYKKLHISFQNNKEEFNEKFKEVFSFLKWNLLGSLAFIGKGQGINILMNIFFGGVINAARSIAFQLHTVITSFSQNFMKAVDPRITKLHANDQTDKLMALINTASKLSYFLLYMITLPFITNVTFVLSTWLDSVPPFTINFTVLVLIDALLLAITDPILTAIQATGNVKKYQLIIGVLTSLNLPLAYITLKIFNNPIIPFIISIVISFFITVAKIVIYKKMSTFSIYNYLVHVILPIILVTVFSFFITYHFMIDVESFIDLVINVAISIISNAFLIFYIGLNKNERNIILQYVPIQNKRN